MQLTIEHEIEAKRSGMSAIGGRYIVAHQQDDTIPDLHYPLFGDNPVHRKMTPTTCKLVF